MTPSGIEPATFRFVAQEIIQTGTNRFNIIYSHESFSTKYGSNQNSDCVGKEVIFLLHEVIT